MLSKCRAHGMVLAAGRLASRTRSAGSSRLGTTKRAAAASVRSSSSSSTSCPRSSSRSSYSPSSSSPSSSSPSSSALSAIPLSAASAPSTPDAIRLVASDVDGTLLDPKQELDPRVAAAVAACELDAGVPLLLATGKAPGSPWHDRLLSPEGGLGRSERGSKSPSPPCRAGVYMQGLYVSDAGGRVLYSRSLDSNVVEAVAELVEANAGRLTLAAYCTPASSAGSSPVRSRVLSSGGAADKRAARLTFYGEPTPEPVVPSPGAKTGATALASAARRAGLDIHKLIVMFDHDEPENEGLDEQLRAAIIALLSGDEESQGSASLCVSLTSALPGMTEVLPPGASKADGVLRYLGEVDISPGSVLAIGDAENDVEMLLLAGIGAAVANAGPGAMAAADVVVPSNAEAGVADAIEKFVLEPRGLRIPPM